ncbi:MAG: hypothetical protein J6039_06380, partial [Alphaproteobacteria bacterium]|nr:hypothetical protein [Alphaproteobacteria bacterium]
WEHMDTTCAEGEEWSEDECRCISCEERGMYYLASKGGCVPCPYEGQTMLSFLDPDCTDTECVSPYTGCSCAYSEGYHFPASQHYDYSYGGYQYDSPSQMQQKYVLLFSSNPGNSYHHILKSNGELYNPIVCGGKMYGAYDTQDEGTCTETFKGVAFSVDCDKNGYCKYRGGGFDSGCSTTDYISTGQRRGRAFWDSSKQCCVAQSRYRCKTDGPDTYIPGNGGDCLCIKEPDAYEPKYSLGTYGNYTSYYSCYTPVTETLTCAGGSGESYTHIKAYRSTCGASEICYQGSCQNVSCSSIGWYSGRAPATRDVNSSIAVGVACRELEIGTKYCHICDVKYDTSNYEHGSVVCMPEPDNFPNYGVNFQWLIENNYATADANGNVWINNSLREKLEANYSTCSDMSILVSRDDAYCKKFGMFAEFDECRRLNGTIRYGCTYLNGCWSRGLSAWGGLQQIDNYISEQGYNSEYYTSGAGSYNYLNQLVRYGGYINDAYYCPDDDNKPGYGYLYLRKQKSKLTAAELAALTENGNCYQAYASPTDSSVTCKYGRTCYTGYHCNTNTYSCVKD